MYSRNPWFWELQSWCPICFVACYKIRNVFLMDAFLVLYEYLVKISSWIKNLFNFGNKAQHCFPKLLIFFKFPPRNLKDGQKQRGLTKGSYLGWCEFLLWREVGSVLVIYVIWSTFAINRFEFHPSFVVKNNVDMPKWKGRNIDIRDFSRVRFQTFV